ncbi:uncharacterized protein DEA37_0004152, partial [Paragonimus westermani]
MYATSKLIIPPKPARNSPFIPKLRIKLRPTLARVRPLHSLHADASHRTTQLDYGKDASTADPAGSCSPVLYMNGETHVCESAGGPDLSGHRESLNHTASSHGKRNTGKRKRTSIVVEDIGLDSPESILTKINLKDCCDYVDLMLDNVVMEVVVRFVYLGSCISGGGGGVENEIEARISKARTVFANLWPLAKLKGRVYMTTVRAVLLYGSKTWPLKVDVNRLQIFDHRCLRSIARIGLPERDCCDYVDLMLDNVVMEVVVRFVYLGSCISGGGGGVENEIEARISKARTVFANLWPLAKLKGRVYMTTVRAVLLYGSKTWPLKVDVNRLQIFDHRCLRSIARIGLPERSAYIVIQTDTRVPLVRPCGVDSSGELHEQLNRGSKKRREHRLAIEVLMLQ